MPADDASTPAAPAALPAITVDIALANSARLLQHAEAETNLALMERLEKLADSWTAIAGLLVAREHN